MFIWHRRHGNPRGVLPAKPPSHPVPAGGRRACQGIAGAIYIKSIRRPWPWWIDRQGSSPVEDDTPPIPGAKQDDGFVVVDPSTQPGNLYPSVSGIPAPYPKRPAPPAPVARAASDNFHYLQGVPFMLSKELRMASNKEAFTTEIVDLLAFLTNKVNLDGYNYDFSTERGVLKEY
ncbi:hypothetical protein K1T71_007554 [Dendrolimus kikuchii]|uniref:Uncharacterized protein n=1 Tax=Dendrolimus kikuchii TaxID=765133 RepID=A0ACC1CY22_9NEOP|nr:hypothetical protein K1T71_007554 [Dendrolimus kikuchii]